MNPHERETYASFVTGLPGATLNEQWESLCAKVGGKVFCLLADRTGALVFKVTEIAFDGLVDIEGIDQAAYFAKRQWVRVLPGALEAGLTEAYIRESHRLVAAKLTRKARVELGI